jgi:hypothetical protein
MCLDLMKEQWDIAIVLDACRYDVFKEVYAKHLPAGRLEKRIGASDTLDWLRTVFNGNVMDNVIYVSAHPGINSKGVDWVDFNAIEHFYKVYDAWQSAWNWNIGTSQPDYVAEVAVRAIYEYPDRRTIIHFMQPHFPYRKAPCPSTYSDLKGTRKNQKLGLLAERMIRTLIASLRLDAGSSRTLYWQVKKILRLDFLEDTNELYWRTYAVSELRRFYRDNLEWVLEPVARIAEEFSDLRIVVTADHGEAFGENGEFFHMYKTRNPVVRCVPFWRNEKSATQTWT